MKEKRKYSQWKFIATFVVVMGIFAGVKQLFGFEVMVAAPKPQLTQQVERKKEEIPHQTLPVENIEVEEVKMPVVRGGAHRVRGVWSYSECFTDIQNKQI